METIWAKTLSWEVFEILYIGFFEYSNRFVSSSNIGPKCVGSQCWAKHMGQSEVLFRTRWGNRRGTWWEHIENLMGTTKIPKEKATGPPWLDTDSPHFVSQEYLCLPVFFYNFGPRANEGGLEFLRTLSPAKLHLDRQLETTFVHFV
jgi:hypothetical protein